MMQNRFDKLMAETLPSLKAASLPFLLAVSGGPDSMVMAGLFHACPLHPGFAVAHCNFSLRGADSDSDEALVREWADERGIRLYVKRFDTKAYASEHSLSVEMAARELRYRWFAELCEEHGHQVLSVAHNANDNAETLFLNLLRGTGINGISGMTLWDELPVPAGGVRLFRPLLGFTRQQIEGFAFAHHIRTCLDKTNLETDYKRNKIRNLVFPIFEEINPSFVKTLAREMEYFTQLKSISDEWYEQNSRGLDPMRIDISLLLSKENWRYLLYRLLEPFGFNSSVIASVQKLLEDARTTRSGKTFEAPEYMLYTTSDHLLTVRKIEDRGNASSSGNPTVLPTVNKPGTALADAVMVIRGPGRYFFNGIHIEVTLCQMEPDTCLKSPHGTVLFDASRLPFPFILRKWESGDWFVPFGMKGRKKVSDFFVDRKYSIPMKEAAVMLVRPEDIPGHVCGIIGERIDDSIRAGAMTDRLVVIRTLGEYRK